MAQENKDKLIKELSDRVLELSDYAQELRIARDRAQKQVHTLNSRVADLELELMGKERMYDEDGDEIDFDAICGEARW